MALFFFSVSTQVRKAHTDIQIPDFTYYRRESTKNPQGSNKETIEARNSFHYLIVGGKFLLDYFVLQFIHFYW